MPDEKSLEYWGHELAMLNRQISVLIRRRDAVRRIFHGLEILQNLDSPDEMIVFEDLDDIASENVNGTIENVPKGRDAVRAILTERGMMMQQRQIFAVMDEKGWIDPTLKDPFTSLRVTLRRMWQSGELEKVHAGVYRLAPVPDDGSD